MELQFSFIIIINTFLLTFIIYKLKFSKPTTAIQKLASGPRKLPIIGNLLQMDRILTHHRLRELASKYGDLMHLQLGRISMLVVSSPEMAKEIMKSHDDAFANRHELIMFKFLADVSGRHLVTSPYGEYWKQIRKVWVMEFLSNAKVRSSSILREHEVSILLQSIESSLLRSDTVNFTEEIFSFTSSTIYKAVLGRKDDRLVSVVEELSSLVGSTGLGDMFPCLEFVHVISGFKKRVKKLYGEAIEIIDCIIDEHINSNNVDDVKEDKREDLVDVLLRLQVQNDFEVPITFKDIRAILLVSL